MSNGAGLTESTALREDILVSVCFGDLSAEEDSFNSVRALAQALDSRFRFREIVVVVPESQREAFFPLVRLVSNLRLFTVRDGTGHYRRRVMAADEAIGDVVLLTCVAELSSVDAVTMIEKAAEHQEVLLATRAVGKTPFALEAPFAALGRATGFKVNPRDLQSMAVPRTLLNHLLAQPDPDLALRFPPRDIRVPLMMMEVAPTANIPREAVVRRRLELLQKLLAYLAPSLLMAVTASSGLLAIAGAMYGFYVFGAWLTLGSLAPGWLTLSVMLSVTALFLGVSIMGLSLGLQLLLARSGHDRYSGLATETNQVDLFGQVAANLNIDLVRGPIQADPPVKS